MLAPYERYPLAMLAVTKYTALKLDKSEHSPWATLVNTQMGSQYTIRGHNWQLIESRFSGILTMNLPQNLKCRKDLVHLFPIIVINLRFLISISNLWQFHKKSVISVKIANLKSFSRLFAHVNAIYYCKLLSLLLCRFSVIYRFFCYIRNIFNEKKRYPNHETRFTMVHSKIKNTKSSVG